MRLKSLRKERPAFENEGAVINGNRMDLSNSELKPSKHRTNNTFALPTSLNNEMSSVNISPANHTPETNPPHTSIRRTLPFSTPSQPTRASSYQALEAVYLEHGIRIHLNSTAATAVTQQQNLTIENVTKRRSDNILPRHKAFVDRNPSRSSSALHYSTVVRDTNQDSRPFSALQQTSTIDFEHINTPHVSNTQPVESQNHSDLSQPLNNNYPTPSTLASEQSNHTILPSQLAGTNSAALTTTPTSNDPDLAYMSSLLKTTSGDTFRDTIRRRAGLRATFAIHRSQPLLTPVTTMSNSKLSDKSPDTQSRTTNHRSSLLRNSTVAITPTILPLSSKKIEKDILKHASRIRTNQIKDSFIRDHSSLRSRTSEQTSSVSTSPTRVHHPNKPTKILKPSKSISLEPLELLLAPPSRSLPPPSPARVTSLSLYVSPAMDGHHDQKKKKSSKKRTKSPKRSFVENNNNNNKTPDDIKTNFVINDQRLPLLKNSPIDIIRNDKSRQSNSSDSGCYDRSSSSADTHSVTSININQASSSLPSARLTSASTRRSNINKKVSFEDPSLRVIVTTATYV